MFDLIQLRTFVTVAQEGHLTRASERLHISQPTASHHIRALEERLGFSLFNRTSKGLELTEAGRQIAEWAAELVLASHQLDARAKELAGAPAGRLTVGTIANPRLHHALASAVLDTRETFPMTTISLEAGNSRFIRQAIKSGDLDAGVIVGVPRNDDLILKALGKLDYVLVAPAAWEGRLEAATPTQIATMPWVVTGGSTPSQDLIERLFREEGLEISAAMEVSNASLLRAMVAAGVGLGFVQQFEAREGVEAGLFIELSQYHASLPLTFVHAKVRTSDRVLANFLQTVQSAWNSLGGPG